MRALTGVVLLAVTLLGGCAQEKTPLPPADAPAEKVLEAFLVSSRAGDGDTGQQLSGECWPRVKGWYANSSDRLTDFTVSTKQASPAATSRTTTVRFTWSTDHSHPRDWVAELSRPDAEHRWNVCSLHSLAG